VSSISSLAGSNARNSFTCSEDSNDSCSSSIRNRPAAGGTGSGNYRKRPSERSRKNVNLIKIDFCLQILLISPVSRIKRL
jgi:hypothetical protein